MDVLARAVRDCGLRTDFEDSGGLHDGGNPVISWSLIGNTINTFSIDVAVTNPLCPSRTHLVEEYGKGGAAVE